MRFRQGTRVPSLTINKIRSCAALVRDFGEQSQPWFDVIRFMEQKLMPDWLDLQVVGDEDLGEREGLTIPDQDIIKLPERVYDGACDGIGQHRFTVAHELGHFFVHRNISAEFARGGASVHPVWQDSEWQADTFAAELLMPVTLMQPHCRCVQDIVDVFGVSYTAARVRVDKLTQRGELRWS